MDYSKAKVAYPKLTLYAFHLYKNLAKNSNPVENANHLWEKCQNIGEKLGIVKLQRLSRVIDKVNQNKYDITQQIFPKILNFKSKKQDKNINLAGEVNPLLIHDTYAVDLTFRYPDSEVELSNLKGLNQDNCLLPSNIKASLGQSLVFFAQPVGNVYDDKLFAEHCVKALISESEFNKLNHSCQNQGKLLNGSIFEYNNDADSPQDQCHILIWLDTTPRTTALEHDGEYYYPLIELLNCRSKIIYARSESRWCYKKAREEYSKLEEKVNQFNELKNNSADSKLKDFNQWLNDIPAISFNYSRYLRDLEYQGNTIKANLKNYKLYFDKIKKLCDQDDLEFLSSFIELAEDTFIEQINTDLAYLKPGQSLFEQLIESIRGIVEIEQTKRDRSLERTVQIWGIGLGGGAIVSGIVTQHIDKPFAPTINFKYPVHPLASSFLWSFIGFLFCLAIGWLVSRQK